MLIRITCSGSVTVCYFNSIGMGLDTAKWTD